LTVVDRKTGAVHVRRAGPADRDAVRTIHRAAFAVPGAPAHAEVVEARLTDELLEDAGFLPHLSLVAVDGDDLVGHVICTRGWVEPIGVPALGLGPLGVLPPAQRSGIGTALVHAVLAVAEAADERLVALLGSPAYYRRFDFVPAASLGLEAPEPSWGEHFQARLLRGEPVPGTFNYAAPFGRV
jgi:putative acetyltransferase